MTDTRKWPVLAQILIALGCINGIRYTFLGFTSGDLIGGIIGVVTLAIFWNVYKFKPWALKALTVILGLSILLSVVVIFAGPPLVLALVLALVQIVIPGLVLIYFNSPRIKSLFQQETEKPAAAGTESKIEEK